MKDVRNRLLEALRRDLLAHAYILEGGDAKARRDLAAELAMMLLCSAAPAPHGATDARPCGVCVACKKAQAGEHPDLSIIEPERGMIRLEAVKALIRNLKYPPFEADMRVCLILEGDKMNAEASNTLLKTLEEPPPQNVFIITVASRHSLLPTIRSRCQTLIMSEGEGRLFPEGATGKERFLQLLEDLEASGMEDLDHERAVNLRDRVLEALRLHFIEGKKALCAARAFSMAREVAKDPALFFVLAQCLKSIARDLLLLCEGDEGGLPRGLLFNEDQLDLLKILASFFNDVDLFEHTFRLQELENMARRGINLEYAINSVILFWFGEHG